MSTCRIWLLPVLLLLMPAAAAEDVSNLPAIKVEGVCVEVQVGGQRTPAWECLQQRLAPARSAAAPDPAQLQMAERLMRQPGNQMLLYNLEGTRQRMGNAFGHSVVPQRPER